MEGNLIPTTRATGTPRARDDVPGIVGQMKALLVSPRAEGLCWLRSSRCLIICDWNSQTRQSFLSVARLLGGLESTHKMKERGYAAGLEARESERG